MNALTGSRKGFAIAIVVLGTLTTLGSACTVANTAYTVITGEAPGDRLMRGVMRRLESRDERVVENYQNALVRQVEALRRVAPLQIATEIPYALGAGIAAVAAALLLAGRLARTTWLARGALVACVARLACGFAQYQITRSAAESMDEQFDQAFEQGLGGGAQGAPASGGAPSASAQRTVRAMAQGVRGAMRASVVASALLWTAGFCTFWGMAAYTFRKPAPAAGPPTMSAEAAGP